MQTKKFGDLEVRIIEQEIPVHETGVRITDSGMGINLQVVIKKNNNEYVLFNSRVREVGRPGDFRHWYTEIRDINKNGDKLYITLHSTYLNDIYEFDLIKKMSRLIKSNVLI